MLTVYAAFPKTTSIQHFNSNQKQFL